VHSLLLKAAATAMTIVAAAAAAIHVSGHVKTSAAPLHPDVVRVTAVAAPGPGVGSLHLTPSVRSGDVEAVTSTAAS
jgi:hypothetical protein